jgi:hypothetical protein
MFRICSEFSAIFRIFRICSEFSAMFRICSESVQNFQQCSESVQNQFRILSNFQNFQTLFRISSTKTGLFRISWLCSVCLPKRTIIWPWGQRSKSHEGHYGTRHTALWSGSHIPNIIDLSGKTKQVLIRKIFAEKKRKKKKKKKSN